MSGGHQSRLQCRLGDRELQITARREGSRVEIECDGETFTGEVTPGRPGVFTVRREGMACRVFVADHDGGWDVSVAGRTYRLEPARARSSAGTAAGSTSEEPFAVSPLTGTVARVLVEPGQTVGRHETLCVVEAMKMEYQIRAPRDLTVAAVHVREGDKVEMHQRLVDFAE